MPQNGFSSTADKYYYIISDSARFINSKNTKKSKLRKSVCVDIDALLWYLIIIGVLSIKRKTEVTI